VVEASGGGTDLVQSSISHTLATNVENVKLTGTAAINATGNDLNNFLDGNDGVNVLRGNGGDDILNGRYGGDTLWGNAGRDTFQFTSKWSADDDRVMDFVRGTDKLDFSGIDANPATAGDQMFIFDGTKGASFSGSNGHIWAVKDSGADVTHLYIKTEGSVAHVDVAGTGYTLAASDFLL
jgi:serralysin